jgi:uncharacterized protein YjiS (DUF1127 family)
MSSMDAEQGDYGATNGNQSGCHPLKRLATTFIHTVQKVMHRLAIRRSEYELLQRSACMLRDIGVSREQLDYLADRGRLIFRPVYIERAE